ncbi:MAG: DJ-1 family glyoxalase III [Luteolibacter sp.]
MPPRALCLLVDGFEEIEAVTPIDLMRRAGIEVVVAAMGQTLHAIGRSGITLMADVILDPSPTAEPFDLLLIPGGPGVANLRTDGRAASLAGDFHTAGKTIAAICAAPLVLMDAGLLVSCKFTAHISTRDELPDAVDARVVTDGHILTSRGAGTSTDFALAIITALVGEAAAKEIATSIMA